MPALLAGRDKNRYRMMELARRYPRYPKRGCHRSLRLTEETYSALRLHPVRCSNCPASHPFCATLRCTRVIKLFSRYCNQFLCFTYIIHYDLVWQFGSEFAIETFDLIELPWSCRFDKRSVLTKFMQAFVHTVCSRFVIVSKLMLSELLHEGLGNVVSEARCAQLSAAGSPVEVQL